ncbi:MAG: ester cyclase [Paracoccaceae bacterium]
MINQTNKKRVLAFWEALDKASLSQVSSVCSQYFAPDCVWNGPAPIYQQVGPEAMAENFWAPLKASIPDLRRQTHMIFGGASSGRADGGADGRMWVCGTGYLIGQAKGAFLDIPVTEKTLRLRWGEFYRIEDGMIVEAQVLIDFVDWFEQVGLSVLPTPLGIAHVYPAPTGYDGLLIDAQDPDETQKTLSMGRDFIYGALNSFDSSELSSMGMENFFHQNVKWYGPGGIGACLSLEEFQERHQKPWLVAFPNRKVQDLESLFAEGALLAGSGVAGVKALHTGPFRDTPASGHPIEFSGLDFWLRSGDKFTENWVFVDMVDMFSQMGHDLFKVMREQSVAQQEGKR